MATASSFGPRPLMPAIRNRPNLVGNLARATTRTFLVFFRRFMEAQNYSRVAGCPRTREHDPHPLGSLFPRRRPEEGKADAFDRFFSWEPPVRLLIELSNESRSGAYGELWLVRGLRDGEIGRAS